MRRGTRTTPSHDRASLPFTSPQLAPERLGTEASRAMLLASGQILEEPHLGGPDTTTNPKNAARELWDADVVLE